MVAKKPKKSRAVVVTTEFRGVFFGYTEDSRGNTIRLTRARNCIYWHQSIGGFLGLGRVGPNSQCKIGNRADIELRKITSVMECTPESIAAWESANVAA